eukprot:Nitzschia sp. Nitz4//scaffold53_size117307//60922//61324//NITZ4_003770-RA/size117307-snap-gene-0.108-mRNA-1//1//CDS//3329554205//2142//frame0
MMGAFQNEANNPFFSPGRVELLRPNVHPMKERNEWSLLYAQLKPARHATSTSRVYLFYPK